MHSEHIRNIIKCHDIAHNATGTMTAMMEMIRENVIKSQYVEQKIAGSQFKIFPHFTFLFVVPVHLLCLQVLMVLKIPQMIFMLCG